MGALNVSRYTMKGTMKGRKKKRGEREGRGKEETWEDERWSEKGEGRIFN